MVVVGVVMVVILVVNVVGRAMVAFADYRSAAATAGITAVADARRWRICASPTHWCTSQLISWNNTQTRTHLATPSYSKCRRTRNVNTSESRILRGVRWRVTSTPLHPPWGDANGKVMNGSSSSATRQMHARNRRARLCARVRRVWAEGEALLLSRCLLPADDAPSR